uniref:Outer membrane protein beta-barrel domain-containing protein n=2 Tax=unclassified Prevotella TaxID=2638335 RepID=A0AB33J3M1_9BACT
MKSFFVLILFLLAGWQTQVCAQGEARQWGIEVSAGGATMGTDDEVSRLNDNQANVFALSVDYYLHRHWAVTGGIYMEQQGLYTNLSSGIGLMKNWIAGIQAGAKWYPLAPKWIVQPYVGANLYTNVLNLPRQRGEKHVHATQAWEGDGVMTYDIQHAVGSISPRIGVDIRLISSVNLTVGWDYRWEFYGHTDSNMRYTSGPMTGHEYPMKSDNSRGVINIGVKVDFPMRTVSEGKMSTLLGAIFGLLMPSRSF